MRRLMPLLVALALVAAGAALETSRPPFALGGPGACVPRWSVVATPAIRDGRLYGVAALSPSDAWAVGGIARSDASGNSRASSTLIEHWEGTAWTRVPSPPVRGWLSDVAYVSAHDVWAVGETPDDSGKPLVEHWNGQSWARVNVPSSVPLADLSVVSARDVWAVGSEYAGNRKVASIVHWDGSAWKEVARRQGIWLSEIAAISQRDVWAVGEDKAERPLALRWDGRRWQSFALPQTPGEEFVGVPDSVDARSTNDVWAAGYAATEFVGTQDPRLWHWDGKRWRIVAADVGLGGLVDVVARPGGEIWVTGSDESPHVDEGSFIHFRAGKAPWRTLGLGAGRYVSRLAIAPGGGVWAVGLDYRGQNLVDVAKMPHPVPLVVRTSC